MKVNTILIINFVEYGVSIFEINSDFNPNIK